MSWDTNGCQRESTAGLRPSLSGAVETAPAGNTTTTPPFSSCARAAAREARLVCQRLLGLAEVDRQDEALHLGRPHQHGVGQDDEVRPDLADQPGDHDPVEHAVGMVGDDHDRAGLRNGGQRLGVDSGRRAPACAPPPARSFRPRAGTADYGCTCASASAARSPSRRSGSVRASAADRSRWRS